MPIQQKLPPPVLLFSDLAGWDNDETLKVVFSFQFHDFFSSKVQLEGGGGSFGTWVDQ